MMHEEIERWRQQREDYLSTGSRSNCDSELGNPGGSERDLLRFAPAAGSSRLVLTKSQKIKGAITLAVIVIVASVFGAIAYSTGDEPKSESLHKSHELAKSSGIVVEELESITTTTKLPKIAPPVIVRSNADSVRISTSTNPVQSRILGTEVSLTISTTMPPRVTVMGQEQSDLIKIEKEHIAKHNGPIRLPENTSKPPMSLLQQVKLLHPPKIGHINFTECFTENAYDKKVEVGWKAYMFIDTERGNIPSSRNPFVGYGTRKVIAQRYAAEAALQTVYPGQLSYPDPADSPGISEIQKYCDG